METLPALSPRELDIVEELTRGYSEKEIAARKHVSPKTVNNHLTNVRKKWNARCAVDIARKFILSLDDPKKYFAVMAFLVIQFHIIVETPDMDLRRPAKTAKRVVRTARRNNN